MQILDFKSRVFLAPIGGNHGFTHAQVGVFLRGGRYGFRNGGD